MSTSTAPDESVVDTPRGRNVVAAVFAIIALVFVVAGIVLAVVPPHLLPHLVTGGTKGHHPLRVAGCVVVGAVFAAGSWFALKYQGQATDPE